MAIRGGVELLGGRHGDTHRIMALYIEHLEVLNTSRAETRGDDVIDCAFTFHRWSDSSFYTILLTFFNKEQLD